MSSRLVAGVCLAAVIGLGCGAEPATERPRAAAPQPADWTSMVRNGRTPLPQVLTGGQPTAEELAALRAAGFETVINLRRPEEAGSEDEPRQVAELGMHYVSIPVAGAEGLTRENVSALAATLESSPRPLLLHCGSGNRVGAMLALKAFWLDDADAEAALETGLAAGLTRLEPAVREILAAANGS